MLFADTSAIYALLDADDSNYENAKAAWFSWLEDPFRFATSNYVLLETIALVQRRLGMKAVRGLYEGIVPLLHVHWVDQQIHSKAVSSLFMAGRRELSLVDCTSFELMRHLGINTVFAFDPHFAEHGFTVLP